MLVRIGQATGKKMCSITGCRKRKDRTVVINKRRKLERFLKHIDGHYRNERGDKYPLKNFHIQ